MTFVDYLGQLIPLDNMTPEMQALFAGCIAVVCLRVVASVITGFFERFFQ